MAVGAITIIIDLTIRLLTGDPSVHWRRTFGHRNLMLNVSDGKRFLVDTVKG
jgi:hypothetical protein